MKYIKVENAHTKHVSKHEIDWTDFVHHLFDHARVEAKPEDKEQTPAFASCILPYGCCRRLKENVVRMSSFIALDLDSHLFIEDLTFALDGIEFVAYNTTQTTINDKRWRIVIRLADEYDPQHHPLVWHYFNELLQEKLGRSLDAATKDTTRLSFFPRNWKNSHGDIFHSPGFPFDVAELVVSGWTPANGMAPQATQGAVQPLIYLMTENVPPPDDAVFTPRMLAKFRAEKKGGRFFRLLVRAAIRYKINDWFLSASDLAAEAKKHDCILGFRNANHEAKNAITHVEQNWLTIKANIEAKEKSKQSENDLAMDAALKRWGVK